MKRSRERAYYPESWYPICLSTELKRGQVLQLPAFDSKLVVFRADDSRVGVVSRYCPHMGTDLTRATVVGDELQCPFHQRRFNIHGKCVAVPGLDKVPRNCHLSALPVREEYGIVFVFLAAKPTFDFPDFPRVNKHEAHAQPVTKTMRTPYHALLFNGFDTHHLGCIHNREVPSPPVFSTVSNYHLAAEFVMQIKVAKFYDILIRYSGADVSDVHLDCWGGNFLIITNKRTKDNILIASYPIHSNLSRVFLTAICENTRDGWVKKMGQFLRLKLTTHLGMLFLKPDENIIEDMRPDIKKLLREQDQGVINFWKYWERLPRDEETQRRVLVSD